MPRHWCGRLQRGPSHYCFGGWKPPPPPGTGHGSTTEKVPGSVPSVSRSHKTHLADGLREDLDDLLVWHGHDALPVDLDDAVSYPDAASLCNPTTHEAADLDGIRGGGSHNIAFGSRYVMRDLPTDILPTANDSDVESAGAGPSL